MMIEQMKQALSQRLKISKDQCLQAFVHYFPDKNV